MKHEIGFHTNCRCAGTVKQTLELIKSASFDNVMLSVKADELVEGLELCKNLGLDVPFVHLPYTPPSCPNINNIWIQGAERDEIIQCMIDQIKICAQYNITIAIVHLTYGRAEIDGDANMGIEAVQRILKATEHCNVKLAFENLELPKYLDFILDNFKDERVGFCYDSGHHYLHAPNVDFIGKYGDRCIAIHLHDNLMDTGDTKNRDRDLHLLPFDGKVDFEKVMLDIAKTSYNGVVLLESTLCRPDIGFFFYERFTPAGFLLEAKIRAQKLAEMLATLKKGGNI